MEIEIRVETIIKWGNHMKNGSRLFFIVCCLILTSGLVYAPPPPPIFGGSGGGGIMDQFGPGIHQSSSEKSESQSGISVQIPSGWTVSEDTKKYFYLQGSLNDALNITFSIYDYGSHFPTDKSLEAYFKAASSEMEKGKIVYFEEKYFDGVRGVLRIEAPTDNMDDPRRITWIGYKGSIGINIVASAKVSSFEKVKDELLNILDSTNFNF